MHDTGNSSMREMNGLHQDRMRVSASRMHSENCKETTSSSNRKGPTLEPGASRKRASSQPPLLPVSDLCRGRWKINERHQGKHHHQNTSYSFHEPSSRRDSKVTLKPLVVDQNNDSAVSNAVGARGAAHPTNLDLNGFGFNSARVLLGCKHRHLVGPPGLFTGCLLPDQVFCSATVPSDILASIAPVPKSVAEKIKEGSDWESWMQSDRETVALRSWLQAELEMVHKEKQADLSDVLDTALKLYQLVHNTLSEKVMSSDKEQGRLLSALWRSQAAVAHRLLHIRDMEIARLKCEVRQQLEDNKIVIELLNEKQQQKKIGALQVELSNCNTENLALKKRVAKLEQAICGDASKSSWLKQLEQENEDIRARNEMLVQQLRDMQIQQMIADEPHVHSLEKNIGAACRKVSDSKKSGRQSRVNDSERGVEGTMEHQMTSHMHPRSISSLGICPWDGMGSPR